jgi:hypothetical protein
MRPALGFPGNRQKLYLGANLRSAGTTRRWHRAAPELTDGDGSESHNRSSQRNIELTQSSRCYLPKIAEHFGGGPMRAFGLAAIGLCFGALPVLAQSVGPCVTCVHGAPAPLIGGVPAALVMGGVWLGRKLWKRARRQD